MNKKSRKLIAVVGPTGSGKTGLGVKLAREFDGEIVSADSRQVYRQLNLGTGKEGIQLPKSKIKSQKSKLQFKNQNLSKAFENICWIDDVPQWMINVKNPGEAFTLFDWLKEARSIVNDIFDRGKVPIVVGGTGLYVQALTEGFVLENNKQQISNDKQKSKYQIPKMFREDLNNKSLQELEKIAQELDIDAENIDIKNKRRLIRAIEKHQNRETPTKIEPDFESMLIAPEWSREDLYARIDKRLDQRFGEGMLKETEELIKNGVDPDWLIGLGLDYKVMTKYLLENSNDKSQMTNKISNDKHSKAKKLKSYKLQAEETFHAMKQDLKTKEHQYAKRQLTWWKRFSVNWVENYKEAKELVLVFMTRVK